jgi:MFS family permease
MNRDLILISISMFTWGLGEGLFIYFQPIYMQEMGANLAVISGILGALGIAMAVAHIPAGYMADRLGRRPVMWASWFLGSAAAWVMALAASLPVFVTGLLMYGLTSFVMAPLNSYIGGARGRWSVGRALTMVSALYSFGAVSGPLLGGLIAGRVGLKRVYLVSACVFCVSTIIILFIRSQPVHDRGHPAEKRVNVFEHRRFTGLLVLSFVTMFAIYLPQPLASLYLQNQRGLSLQAIGQLGSLGSLGNAVLQLVLGQLNTTLGLALGQVSLALFSLLLWQGTGMPWFGLAYFFIGGYRLARQMVLALARPLVHSAEVGLAYGLIETANGSTVILAPLAAGALYAINPSLPFPASITLIGLTLTASLVFLLTRRPSADVSTSTEGAVVPPPLPPIGPD